MKVLPTSLPPQKTSKHQTEIQLPTARNNTQEHTEMQTQQTHTDMQQNLHGYTGNDAKKKVESEREGKKDDNVQQRCL